MKVTSNKYAFRLANAVTSSDADITDHPCPIIVPAGSKSTPAVPDSTPAEKAAICQEACTFRTDNALYLLVFCMIRNYR